MLTRLQFPEPVWSAVIQYVVVDLGLETFDDFRCKYSKDTDFQDVIISKIKQSGGPKDNQPVDQPGKWGARLYQAWESFVAAHGHHQEILTKGAATDDMDKLLDKRALDSLQDSFWARYRLEYPAHLTPGDSLISKKKRELDNFLLTVGDPLKARSLTFDRNHDPRKEQLTDTLTYQPKDAQREVNRSGTVDNWLAGLWLELLALAIAGSTPVDPQPIEPEERKSEAAKYVVVPLCTVIRYIERARECSALVPQGSRYLWLKARCKAERTDWMDKHRKYKIPLGQIIERVYLERNSVWELTTDISPQVRDGDTAALKRQLEQVQAEVKRLRSNPGGGGASISKSQSQREAGGTKQRLSPSRREIPGKPVIMKTNGAGAKLCPDFQYGKCKKTGKECEKGHHKCAGLMPGSSSKVCGLSNHGAETCKRAQRA